MKLHANARTCPKSRRLIVDRVEEEGWSLAEAAEAAGVSERTARSGSPVIGPRASGAARSLLGAGADPAPHAGAAGRGDRCAAPAADDGGEIAETLAMALSTVSVVLKRIGLGKRSRLEPPEPPNRYERGGRRASAPRRQEARADLARRPSRHRQRAASGPRRRHAGVAGWEFVHVCVDDHTRLAYAEVLPDESGQTAVAFLRRALDWFAERGVRVSA